MGFIKDDVFYVPNSVLKDDVRQIAKKPSLPVVAIFTKNSKDTLYTTMSYISKNSTVEDIVNLPCVKGKVE